MLEAEMARLEKLVSADKETQRQYAALQTLTEKLNDSKGASPRLIGIWSRAQTST